MTNATPPVRYNHERGAAWFTLNRPDTGNAIDLALVESLATAVRRARDDDARVVVLQATGRASCVGGKTSFSQVASPGDYVGELANTLHRALCDLQDLNAVVVSVVRGVAAGAGRPLATSADLVLAEAARCSRLPTPGLDSPLTAGRRC